MADRKKLKLNTHIPAKCLTNLLTGRERTAHQRRWRALRLSERLGLTGIAGEPDVLKRIHELNLFRAVCFCWLRRLLVDAGQYRTFVVFGDEPKSSFCPSSIQFDADLIVRFAIGLVLQDAFKDLSVLPQCPLCLVDFPASAACDGDEFPILAGFRSSCK